MSQVYHNPIARNGDFADPFVLRHDGRYYLYATNPDVRCWTSSDLVTWSLNGPTIADDIFPELVPFAPEVVYADGAFYMYTSPSGHGHFVLRANLPTGPFVPVTGNVGHAIDGNVFLDDDGRRYFYWAGDEGIWGCEMPSPTEFGEPVFTGIHMNGWTEGPFVSKRDGRYQMTLTGNHYLSRGYRIDAATSSHPLGGYEPAILNPILVGADGPATGLGHSSTVVGPDLVSTWIVYHNINPNASRDLNIDRQVAGGRSLMVLGPTTAAPVPSDPDIVWSGHDSAPVVDRPFTAEVNLTAPRTAGRYGIDLGPGSITVHVGENLVRAAGFAGDAAAPVPSGFRHDVLHCWTLMSNGEILRVLLDGRVQFTVPFPSGPEAAISPFCDDGDLTVGHCALTATTPDEADRTTPKPVPGRFWAAGDEAGVILRPGAEVEHVLGVQAPGRVRVHLAGSFSAGDEISVDVDDVATPVRADGSLGLVAADVSLALGSRRLVLRGTAGAPRVRLVTVTSRQDPASAEFTDESVSGWGKRLLAPTAWDDVEVTARLTPSVEPVDAHADLLIRATQLAEGGDGSDTRLGIDFLLGYSVQLHRDCIVLARHDYDTKVLTSAPLEARTGPRHLVVRAIGDEFTVDLDGTEVIRTRDELPHVAGSVGLRAAAAELRADSVRISAFPAHDRNK